MSEKNANELDLATLRTRQHDRVLTVRTSTPPLDFATPDLIADLDRLTRAVDHDPTVGAVVLTGDTERRFLTHADPFAIGGMIESSKPELPIGVLEYLVRALGGLLRLPGMEALVDRRGGDLGIGVLWSVRWKRTILRMNRSSTVYIAAINGPTLGGGHELALACDIRYVSDSPEIRLGQVEATAHLIPGGGGTQRLPRMIGTAKALEHILEGRGVSPEEALELGVVHRIVPEEKLVGEAQSTAARLARRAPVVVQAIKRSIYFATDRRISRGLDYEQAGFFAAGSARTIVATLGAMREDIERLGDSPLIAEPGPWVEGTRVDQVGLDVQQGRITDAVS